MPKDKTQNAGQDEFIFEELEALDALVKKTEGLPEDLEEKLDQILNRLNRMARLGHYASEFETSSRYIETLAAIPWKARTTDNMDLANAKAVLDKNHYGMEWVKEKILEYLATRKLIFERSENPDEALSQSLVLLFVGLQGIGKTTLARSIAEALGREFIRVSLGAIGSTYEIRGMSKAFPEAEPGQIVKAMIKSKVRNPVILLDEIDKASGQEGLRTDIMSALLEILDPEQNKTFRDHYVDYPMNLSDIMFICSANNTGTISTPLMDRLEVIKMPAYTDNEKITIGRQYLLPEVLKRSGLKPDELEISPELWEGIVRPFGYDSGIRSLNRTLSGIARKAAKEIVEGKATKVVITKENLKYYLPQ